MKRALLFAVIVTCGALSPAPFATPAIAAVAAPEMPAPAPGQAPNVATMDDTAIAELTVKFLEFYLAGLNLAPEQIDAIYADKVDYFGEKEKSRADIIRDKQAYYRRWPQRRYTIVPDTINIYREAGGPQLIDITFEYDFDVRSNGRRERGRGEASLTIDFATPNGAIVREEGKVLSRGVAARNRKN